MHRVLNIIEEAKLGGPQVRIVRVAKSMTRTLTHVLLPYLNSSNFTSNLSSAGLSFTRLPLTCITRQPLLILLYILLFPVEIILISLTLFLHDIHLVHVSGGSWQIKGAIASFISRKPFIWHLNDTHTPEWIRHIFSLLSPLASGFIYASQRTKSYYCSLVPDHLPSVIIPSAVNYRPPAHRLSSDSQPLRLITLANLNRNKGFDTLFSTLIHLSQSGLSFHLTIVGTIFSNQRDLYSHYTKLLQEHDLAKSVTWYGFAEDVFPLLESSDIYVCASDYESSPVSVWESMISSLPVVSTDVGDVSYHLNLSGAGFISPVGDSYSLSQSIKHLATNTSLRLHMGRLAYHYAVNTFTANRIADQTETFYSEVLTSSRV